MNDVKENGGLGGVPESEVLQELREMKRTLDSLRSTVENRIRAEEELERRAS